MADRSRFVLRRIPRLWAALLHLGAFALAAALFAGRKLAAFRWEAILERAPDFYSHVSNFSIGYVLYAGIGYLWLLLGVPVRAIAALGLVLAGINLVYELFVPVLNTPDPIDALYGLAGIALGAAMLWLIGRWGVQPAASREPPRRN